MKKVAPPAGLVSRLVTVVNMPSSVQFLKLKSHNNLSDAIHRTRARGQIKNFVWYQACIIIKENLHVVSPFITFSLLLFIQGLLFSKPKLLAPIVGGIFLKLAVVDVEPWWMGYLRAHYGLKWLCSHIHAKLHSRKHFFLYIGIEMCQRFFDQFTPCLAITLKILHRSKIWSWLTHFDELD